jgi:transposase-like protein
MNTKNQSKQALSAAPSTESVQDLLKTRSRRAFTKEYKLSILRKAEACKHGELGELLRKEKLYSNQLSLWRRKFIKSGEEALAKSAPDPAPKLTSEQKQILLFEQKIVKLKKQPEVKDQRIDLQKKALSIIEQLEQASAP